MKSKTGTASSQQYIRSSKQILKGLNDTISANQNYTKQANNSAHVASINRWYYATPKLG
jgi:hypothetical protein